MLSHTLVVDAIYYGNLESVLFPVDYTAIVGFNDTRTYSVMNFLLKNGYRVPEDISVISFDYLRQMQPYLLPLTSISAPPDKNMADTAVELLLRRMKNPEAPAESVILPVMIYDEGTTGTVSTLDAHFHWGRCFLVFLLSHLVKFHFPLALYIRFFYNGS